MTGYVVRFDIVNAGYRDYPFVGFGLLFVIVGIAVVVLAWRRRASRGLKLGAAAWLGCAVLWTVLVLVGTWTSYSQLASALRNGRCDVVEGVVTHFHPMPYAGHEDETFDVRGEHFRYSDFNVTPGFHQTQSHGGPLREGLQVRIHHVGNDIARLETVP